MARNFKIHSLNQIQVTFNESTWFPYHIDKEWENEDHLDEYYMTWKKKKERPNIHSKATKKKVDNILFTIRLHHTTTPFYATYTPRTSTLLRRQIRTRIVNNNKPQFLWFIRMTTFITYRDYTRIYLSTKGCLGLRNYGWKIGSNLTLGFSNRAHYVFAVI